MFPDLKPPIGSLPDLEHMMLAVSHLWLRTAPMSGEEGPSPVKSFLEPLRRARGRRPGVGTHPATGRPGVGPGSGLIWAPRGPGTTFTMSPRVPDPPSRGFRDAYIRSQATKSPTLCALTWSGVGPSPEREDRSGLTYSVCCGVVVYACDSCPWRWRSIEGAGRKRSTFSNYGGYAQTTHMSM